MKLTKKKEKEFLEKNHENQGFGAEEKRGW